MIQSIFQIRKSVKTLKIFTFGERNFTFTRILEVLENLGTPFFAHVDAIYLQCFLLESLALDRRQLWIFVHNTTGSLLSRGTNVKTDKK